MFFLSILQHDSVMANKLKYLPSTYLKRMFYDTITYQSSTLHGLIEFADQKKLMFGSDHPFFPPTETLANTHICNQEWESTTANYSAMKYLSNDLQNDILYQNAMNQFLIDFKNTSVNKTQKSNKLTMT